MAAPSNSLCLCYNVNERSTLSRIFQQFHNLAYKAAERKELLSAINVFLDDSIVLPPGDWERKALLPFSELKAKSDAIRRRRNKQLGAAGGQPPDDDPKKGSNFDSKEFFVLPKMSPTRMVRFCN